MKNDVYELKRDEFALKHLLYNSSECAVLTYYIKMLGFEIDIKKVWCNRMIYSKEKTKYRVVSKCLIVSIPFLEKVKPLIKEYCDNTWLRPTNPSKYSGYRILEKALRRAKRGYDENLPKDACIYDNI